MYDLYRLLFKGNGYKVLFEDKKPHKSGCRTRKIAVFLCPAFIRACSRRWREGGEYNTLLGNKPACLLLGFLPPAADGSKKALCSGCSTANKRALI